MRATLLIISIIAWAILNAAALAQTSPVADSPQPMQIDSAGVLSVTSEHPGTNIDVFDGTRFLGTTPLSNVRVGSGLHVLRYSPQNAGTWHAAVRVDTVIVRSGDSVAKVISVPALRTITSEPYDALIYAGDSLLGRTPSMLYLDPSVHVLRFEKAGYADRNVPITADSQSIHVILAPGADQPGTVGNEALEISRHRTDLPLYVSTGVAVSAGVVAAYCKIKADNYYSDYRNTGDDLHLADVHRLDNISGISLVISEISMGVLSYLLLTR